MKISWSKSYFMTCFIAACIAACIWGSVVIFAFATRRITTRNVVGLFLPLAVFTWGAKQMLDGYHGKF
ncbi:MAG: hypothetical protein WCF26_04710 [Candidatus Sulfotelmatobacter sp.]